MSLVTQQNTELFNGVSQHPATMRLPSQNEVADNVYATVVDGVGKRPPFEHIAQVDAGSLSSGFIHAINRDTTERYFVVVSDGNVRVFDDTGTERTVNAPEGLDYLDLPGGADAATSYAVVTINDYSFVVNKTVEVATKAAPSATPVNIENWYFPPDWGLGAQSQGFYFNPAQGTFRGTRQTFQDLPKPEDTSPPQEGDVWKVAGFDQDSFGAYYVVRRGGVWEETHAPGASTTLDEDTMPHALISEADGTFTFTVFPWKARKIGDDESNPPPTFVGRRIQDVAFHRNRLLFVAGENVVFSAAGDFGNFFRTTVTDLLDSDLVDVAVSNTKVSLLRYAVPLAGNLMLFADQSQFQLSVDQTLTPRSVSVDTVTEYEMDSAVRPVGVGTDVYFVTPSGAYSRLREYFVNEDSTMKKADDVSSHVPRFLPQDIRAMAGNDNEEAIFLTTGNNVIYCYRFMWGSPTQKVQSAWFRWNLAEGDSVLSLATLQNQLYVLIAREGGTFLERCNIQSGATTGDLGHPVLLDRLASAAGVFLSAEGRTVFDLPYLLPVALRDDLRLVRGSGYGADALSLVDPSQYTFETHEGATRVSVPGDVAGTVWAGLRYDMRFTLSEQFLRGREGPVTTGRLMLRTFTLYYSRTAFFRTEVAPYGTDPLVETIVPANLADFSGKTVGDSALVLGAPQYATGQYRFQIYGDSRVARVSLVNDTHVTSFFQSLEWEALYHNRARAL